MCIRDSLNDDSSQHQGFISKEESREKWGDKFATYYKKISEACEAVVGKAIVYDLSLIHI